MAFTVNTNIAALSATRILNQTNSELDAVQTRVNTGLKVSSVKDNPATFAIAQNLRGDLRGLNAIRTSLDRASSVLDVTITAAETISDLLIQAQEIAVASSDPSLDDDSVKAFNNDFAAIIQQINSVAEQATFNGTNIIKDNPDKLTAVVGIKDDGTPSTISLNGIDMTADGALALTADATLANIDVTSLEDFDLKNGVHAAWLDANETTSTAFSLNGDGTAALDLSNAEFVDPDTTPGNGDEFARITVNGNTFQTTAGTFNNITEAINGKTAADFKLSAETNVTIKASDVSGAQDNTNITLSEIDLTNDFDRAASIEVVKNYLTATSKALADLGSVSKQLDLQSSFADKLSDTLEAGIGNLVDADLARDSARLQALQVKQQLGIQALSIANQSPQSILSLFQ